MITRADYEEYLNEIGIPENDKWSNGGRIRPTCTQYGTWMRINDPIAFNVGYQDYIREQPDRKGRRQTDIHIN